MKKNCAHCNSVFEITNKEISFYEKVSPIFGNKKLEIPLPNKCPGCRQQQRLTFRNERNLFKRKCDLSGENIMSMFSSDVPFPVYSNESWWSDKWDAKTYGQEINFSSSFFEQLYSLNQKVPHLQNVGSSDMKKTNSIYVNFAGWNKNCYLIFDSDYNEGCSYSNVIKHSKYCFDCSYVSKSQFCYD